MIYFLSIVFFLLAILAASAVPYAARDGYKVWPIYAASGCLAVIGLVFGAVCH
jgi:hypothetical protein